VNEAARTRHYGDTRSHLCGSDSSAVAGAPTRRRTAHASGFHLHLPPAQAARSIPGCDRGSPSSILLTRRTLIVAYRPRSASLSMPTSTLLAVNQHLGNARVLLQDPVEVPAVRDASQIMLADVLKDKA
jgi:hypothetical protein